MIGVEFDGDKCNGPVTGRFISESCAGVDWVEGSWAEGVAYFVGMWFLECIDISLRY